MNHYTYEEIEVGHKESFKVNITEKERDMFREITGDVNPLHNDKEYAEKKGHDRCVAFGMLTASYLSTLAGVYLPGERSLIHSVTTKFKKPVYVGDELTIEGTVTEKHDAFKLIFIKVEIKNQDNAKVLKGEMQVSVED